MTIDCAIRYDNNPQGIFYVGQTLTGSVVLQLTEAESINGVYIKIEGFTAVHWSERRPQGQRRRSRHFSGRHDYLNTLTYLVGAQHGPAIEIPQGTHVHSFACALPDSLPTSYEGQHGHIRYTITVIVERPSQQNTTYREAFTVLRNVNLNDDPSLRNPTKLEQSKTFGWWIFKSDPLDVTVEIPSTGYVPGQNIPVTVQWINNSNAYIHGVRIKLYKNEEYSATDPYEKTCSDSESIVKIENRDIHKQGQVKFERNLSVPPLPSTSTSPLITISYELAVYVHVSTGDNPVFRIPITIGTIPLTPLPPSNRPEWNSNDPPPQPPAIGFNVKGEASDYPSNKGAAPTMTQTATPTATQTGTASSSSQSTTHENELPPPTYEETMNATATNLQEDQGSEQIGFKPFIPRYPVYNFGGPKTEDQ